MSNGYFLRTAHLSMAMAIFLLGAAQIDTLATVALIEERMTAVDKSPLIAEFVKLPSSEDAVQLKKDDPIPADAEARYEIYGNEDGSVAGLMEFLKSPLAGVEQVNSYYFDVDGSTIAAWWRTRWTFSKCSDSLAVETHYSYVFPADKVLEEYATLTDGKGHDLDAAACTFPDLEQRYDLLYHREWVLAMKHISIE